MRLRSSAKATRHAPPIKLAGVDLTGAILKGADLRGVDLSETLGLTQHQIDSAITDEHTRLPEGLYHRTESESDRSELEFAATNQNDQARQLAG